MRLDKYISSGTDWSRSEVRKLARAGLVWVNGEQVKDVSLKLSEGDSVEVDGVALSRPAPRYFMLNKPEGYICATTEGEHPSVLDLLDEPRKSQLQIAGRLDVDTTGLVLITDDGQWNHAVTSPRRECVKIYEVTTVDDIDQSAIELFARGIRLDGEAAPTRPAELELLYSNECRLSITEGRYHQVKRMFAALGNRVENLHRAQVGEIVLDDDLELGEYRPLTQQEILSVQCAKVRD